MNQFPLSAAICGLVLEQNPDRQATKPAMRSIVQNAAREPIP
jgi:hypothetical protein